MVNGYNVHNLIWASLGAWSAFFPSEATSAGTPEFNATLVLPTWLCLASLMWLALSGQAWRVMFQKRLKWFSIDSYML